jgi:AmmeMemoRadiSam system protein B
MSDLIWEAYRRYRAALEADPFLPAQHAGGSYPDTEEEIVAFFRDQFLAGTGAVPSWDAERERACVPGLIVPHLDFRVGGPVYSWAYDALLREGGWPETFIVLGVGHKCPADVSLLARGYRTMLGEVECDMELARELESGCSEPIDTEGWAHWGEHSIEFVVIFLQALRRLVPELPPFQFVPVLCGGMHGEIEAETTEDSTYGDFAEVLHEVCQARAGRVCVIGSVDGAHVGPRFGHRFKVNPQRLQEIAKQDHEAWEAVADGGAEHFFTTFLKDGNSRHFDGVGVLYVMLRALRQRALFSLLKYDQWFEKRDASVVTLASGIFRAA